jgi:CMP-N-acetylneuraminic acid synthetase/spore coat polysaccharide biosynthesis predicted glycosyltransferase SpsG
MKILAVVPARGGSKGIPRKNLRILGGKPLIQYAIEAALQAKEVTHVVVTSDNLEIQLIAENMGVYFIKRHPDLCTDETPLDPVVFDAYSQMLKIAGVDYDAILTIQPTSPFISGDTISRAVNILVSKNADTLFSVVDDTHLSWREDRATGIVTPNYEQRLNRQWLPRTLKETGSIQLCLSSVITASNRVGQKIELLELDEREAIDIDTPINWKFCESMVARKRYVFVVVGDEQTGSGHAHRVKTIAEYLAGDETVFLCLPHSNIAYNILKESNYRPIMVNNGDLADQVLTYSPDIIVNDILDTSPEYMRKLQKAEIFTVNFEDVGEGAFLANIAFNALYSPQRHFPSHILFGEKYFCMRGEFSNCSPYRVKSRVRNVLLTFGGTDPANLTLKTLLAIGQWCAENEIKIETISGPGYIHWDSLNEVAREMKNVIKVSKKVQAMSFPMKRADVCFTSCGRTIYELASLGVPTICMAQNEREETHTFARLEKGINYIGRGWEVTEEKILDAFKEVASSRITRQMMHEVMKKHDLGSGSLRVLRTIEEQYNRWKQA